jgi:HEAT repeat protein
VSARRRGLFAAAIALFALAPAATVVRQAWADEDEEGDGGDDDAKTEVTSSEQISKKKKATLTAIPTNEAALINVTAREMPASPDILNLGKRSTKALARCVADNVDDHLRYTCASLLGRLGDRAALPALQGALEAWDPWVRGAAIEALRRIPDASSFEPLRKLLLRDDEVPQNKSAVLEAIGALSDKRAVGVLRDYVHVKKDSKDEKAGLNLPAFRGLWKSRHLMARSTLVEDVKFALQHEDVSLQVEATFAAAELRAPELVPVLVPLMQNLDQHLRNRAVYALGRIGDSAATTALLAQVPKVREARMLNNIAFALERLDAKAFYATAEGLIAHKQAAIRMNAAFVLGDVKRPEGLPLLKKALDDKNDYVRVSAVAAIGKLDAPEAMPLLDKFVDDPNPTLKKAAVYALFALSDGAKKDLVYDKLYASPLGKKEPATKLAAAIALGKVGDTRVAPDLVACVEQQKCSLHDVDGFFRTTKVPEIPGRLLLEWAKGRTDLTDLVGSLKPAGAGPLAVSAVQASLAQSDLYRTAWDIDLAGDLDEKTAVAILEPLLSHESTRLRLHAAVALAREGITSADAVIFKDLDNVPEDRLPMVAKLIGRIKEPTVRARLEPELKKRESATGPGTTSIALAAAGARFAWDPEAAFFRFLDALAAPSSFERDLAVRYLRRDRRAVVTYLLRRALAREERPVVRDLLRKMLDQRAGLDEETT